MRVISSPATVTLPSDGTSSPPSRFSRVVLPEPLGPMNAMNSPASTSRLRPWSTWISSPPRRYVLPSPRARIKTSPLPRPSILTINAPSVYELASAGGAPAPRRPAARTALALHARGLTVAQVLDAGRHDLLTVGQARQHLALVAAHLAEAHRPTLHTPLAVHEDRRGAALLEHGRLRHQRYGGAGGHAPLLAEERHLHAHVGQDPGIETVECGAHLDRGLLPVGRRDHRAHLGRDLPVRVRVE